MQIELIITFFLKRTNFRCDNNFDCDDGSDENEDICDSLRNRHETHFTCCSSDRKVLREHLCDGYDDCPRDKSDQFLEACEQNPTPFKTEAEPGYFHCPKAATQYLYGVFNNQISRSQLGDNIVDCLFSLDETCSWKHNLQNWRDPTKFDKYYLEYVDFMKMLRQNPISAKWYTMVSKEQARDLGHEEQVVIILAQSCYIENMTTFFY